MRDYKKRAKAGWSTGKGEKESSNRSERMFSKELLNKEELLSSEAERLSIKNEIKADEYDRETYLDLIENNPDLIKIRETPNRENLKKKRLQKKKSLTDKIKHYKRKLEALTTESYGSAWLRRYYSEKIESLKVLLGKNKDKESGTQNE